MRFHPARALREFVSTFKEWHYWVGGIAKGFVAGWIAGSLFTLALVSLL